MSKHFLIALLFCLTSLMGVAQDFTFNGVKPAVVIDVRTPEEYAAGHIDGALNIPFDQIDKGIQSVKGLNKDQPILLYCRTGNRSGIAKETLEKQGYRQVINGGAFEDVARSLK